MALLSNRFLIFWRLRNRDKARSGAPRQTANSCLNWVAVEELSFSYCNKGQAASSLLFMVYREPFGLYIIVYCILQQSSVKKHFFHRYKTPQLSFLLACSAVLEWFQGQFQQKKEFRFHATRREDAPKRTFANWSCSHAGPRAKGMFTC